LNTCHVGHVTKPAWNHLLAVCWSKGLVQYLHIPCKAYVYLLLHCHLTKNCILQRTDQVCNCIMDEASRRLAVLERQCCAGPGPSSSSLSQQQQSSSYASVTGTPSSYARVHGHVSQEPARWREIQCVAKERLEEVKYAKSDEGIAKVVNHRKLQMAVVLLSLPGFEINLPLLSCRYPSIDQRNAMRSLQGQVTIMQAAAVASSKCQHCWETALGHFSACLLQLRSHGDVMVPYGCKR
jgi:hypothetical protein